jgi:hypothetical protein
MSITGAQLTTARELIGLLQAALALQFLLGRCAVIEFEACRKSLSWQTRYYLKRAHEAAGLEFTKGNPGVVLRKAK